jgi:tripartite-type tricarboxylate transporter receptor subunit TctC
VLPAGASKAIAAQFSAQLNRIIASTEFGNRMLLQGAEPATSTPQELMQLVCRLLRYRSRPGHQAHAGPAEAA